ncbi:alpha-aminoadipate carrier protein LysW [Nocardiopsis sp. Huas11]|nr:alpha-aminoadipate carrier protein LysW [Nocardiopsis sp. Huas11]
MSAVCPECESPVQTSVQLRLSEVIDCADCRTELEVVAVEPVLLALAPEVEEDWGE